MEHRCGVRRPVGLRVAVRIGEWARIPVKLRDVSIGGAFIEMASDRLPRFTGVEIELTVPDRGSRVRYRCPAMVVRVEPDGAALMFDEVCPAGVASFLTWLDSLVLCRRTDLERIPRTDVLTVFGDGSMADRHRPELRY